MNTSDLTKKISDIPKGKTSLTEALKELELSKEAFVHAGLIQERLNEQESQILDLKNSMQYLVSLNFLNTKLEETTHNLDKILKNRVEELSISMITQLNNKISMPDVEPLINKKTNWESFNNLSQKVGLIKTRLDKHVFADFESFKTKVKLEISGKKETNKGVDANNEEIVLIKSRLATVEQQLQSLFNEEEVFDEDYDSKEELDDITNNLEMAAVRDLKSQDFTENSESKKIENNISEAIFNESPEETKFSKPPLSLRLEDPAKSLEINLVPKSSESRSLLRKNSRESSAASRSLGGNSALIKLLNKKIGIIEKEIEDLKSIFELSNQDTKKLYDQIGLTNNRVDENNEKFKNIEDNIQTIQASFLRAIRRSGISKEKIEPQEKIVTNEKNNTKELESIKKNIEEKFKRIVTIEADYLKLENDLAMIKILIKEKLKDFMQPVQNQSDVLKSIQKEIENLKNNKENLEGKVNEQILAIKNGLESLKGPLTSMISDQNRENTSLKEEVKRNQELFRSFIGGEQSTTPDLMNVRSSQISREKNDTKRSHSRINSATPTLSVKHRYYKANNLVESINPEENWLSFLPDGKAVWLPRVAKSAGKNDRKVCTPEVDFKPKLNM